MGRRDPLPDSLDVNRDALSYFKVGTIYPGLPDRRDFMRVAKSDQVAALPDEFELPEDEEENQGPTGACGAFTVVQALEHEYKRQGQDIEFSPLFQYLLTLQEQNVLCQDFGSFMRTAFSIPIKYGALLESMMPYGSRNLCIPPEAHLMQAATAYKPPEGTGQYVKAGASLQDMMSMLYGTNGTDGHPPCMAFLVYSNFQPNERGETPMPSGTRQGGHAVEMHGWSRRRNKVKYKNWWTRLWGANGYGWAPMELFGLDPNQGGIWFDDAYSLDITLPVTPEPEPEPQPEPQPVDGYAAARFQDLQLLRGSVDWYTTNDPNPFAVALCQWHIDVMQGFQPPTAAATRRPRPTQGGT